MQDILNNYYFENILTKKEEIQNKKDELENFWNEVLKNNENTYMYNVLTKSKENKDSLFQVIKRYYNENKNEIKKELINACKGINYLQNKKEKTRIPVFATIIASNPHEFDKKTLCGRLFIQLLCNKDNVQYPKNNEELAELYYNNNLLVDDVSNMVLCKNIVGLKKANEGNKTSKKN